MRDIPPSKGMYQRDTASPISRMASFRRAGPMRGKMGLGRVNIGVSAAAHWSRVQKPKSQRGIVVGQPFGMMGRWGCIVYVQQVLDHMELTTEEIHE